MIFRLWLRSSRTPAPSLEAEEPVVGLVSLLDLVGHLAGAPRALLLERRALLDPAASAHSDLVAALVGRLGIEHQDEFVFGGWLGQNGRGG